MERRRATELGADLLKNRCWHLRTLWEGPCGARTQTSENGQAMDSLRGARRLVPGCSKVLEIGTNGS